MNLCAKCGKTTHYDPNIVLSKYCKCTTAPFVPLQGWICPRCGSIHAPFVSRCFCPPPTQNTTGSHVETIKE